MITNTYTPKNIVYAGQEPVSIPVTIKTGVQYQPGQVLAYNTSTGLYEAYVNGGSNGLGTPLGVLPNFVDTTSANGGGVQETKMYVARGILLIAQLTYDTGGLTGLGRVVESAGRNLLVMY